MADLQDKLNQILSNPEALGQIRSLGEQLGLNKDSSPTATATAPQPPYQQQPQRQAPQQISPPSQNSIISGDMMNIFTKVAPMLSSMNSENNTTTLLHALRPFLSYERQQRLDKAEKMLKIIKLMPLLKENGLFM